MAGRGDHFFLHPEKKHDPDYKNFVDRFKEKTGAYPIYPVFHVAQALAALQGAYAKAAAQGGWPDTERLVDAMHGLEFQGLGRPVKLREDNQGLEDQMVGVTKHVPEYDFAVMDNMMIFPAEQVTTPVGQISEDWVKSLTAEMLNIEVTEYRHGS